MTVVQFIFSIRIFTITINHEDMNWLNINWNLRVNFGQSSENRNVRLMQWSFWSVLFSQHLPEFRNLDTNFSLIGKSMTASLEMFHNVRDLVWLVRSKFILDTWFAWLYLKLRHYRTLFKFELNSSSFKLPFQNYSNILRKIIEIEVFPSCIPKKLWMKNILKL